MADVLPCGQDSVAQIREPLRAARWMAMHTMAWQTGYR